MRRSQDPKQAPSVSQRPFPWRCHECGDKAVQLSRIQYEATLRHDGRLHSFTIPELELPVCNSCGAKVFTESVDQQIGVAFRTHARLLQPKQIRDAIRRVGGQQKGISQRLGIAEETLSRWLNESQIQSRSMDTLLRIYFAFPEVRETLTDEAKRADLGLADVSIPPRTLTRLPPPASYERRFAPSEVTMELRNGERDKCRRAQHIVQSTGSAWGRTNA